jgi:hypothetical protein
VSPIDPERAFDPCTEPVRRTVGISSISLQGRKLAAAAVNWDHARELEGAELCVKWVDDVPVCIPWYGIGDELGGNSL